MTDAAAAKEQLQNLDELYRFKIGTRSAVEYWTKKATEHRGDWEKWFNRFQAIIVGVVSVVALLIGGGLVIAYFRNEGVIAPIWEMASKLAKLQFSPVTVTLLTIPVVAGLWLLRHYSRRVSINQNLMHDAEQRAVFVNTFLALKQEERANLSDAERLIVLQAIFRGTTASGEEDPQPAALLELLKIDKAKIG